MINDNLKQLTKVGLQSHENGVGMVPVRDLIGNISYAAPTYSFPSSRTVALTYNATAAGVSFGSGDAPATEFDNNLENTITSGLTTTVTYNRLGYDYENSAPYVEWCFTITNTSAQTITIKEVGYKQPVSVARYPGYGTRVSAVCLIDRTVLDTPLVLVPEDVGILTYRLTTVLPEHEKVNNIKIVRWEDGADEDITAMIQAAHAGTIDLQTDAGWRIGMKRPITISAFTGGGSVAHAEQTIDLVITSFDDYESCGCVMQVDFDEALATGQRMEASGTNKNGYDGSEMCTTTLPALVQALPQYLQDMLITFTCKASVGNKSSVIEEITGNKLALRSLVELKGPNTMTAEGEGSWIPYYKTYNVAKRRGRAGGTSPFWTRSPALANSSSFCTLTGNSSASNANGLAPFGCL